MNRKTFLHQASLGLFGFLLLWTSQTLAQGFEGYYQHPDLHGSTLVFVYPFAQPHLYPSAWRPDLWVKS
jgi:hypothetical protein